MQSASVKNVLCKLGAFQYYNRHVRLELIKRKITQDVGFSQNASKVNIYVSGSQRLLNFWYRWFFLILEKFCFFFEIGVDKFRRPNVLETLVVSTIPNCPFLFLRYWMHTGTNPLVLHDIVIVQCDCTCNIVIVGSEMIELSAHARMGKPRLATQPAKVNSSRCGVFPKCTGTKQPVFTVYRNTSSKPNKKLRLMSLNSTM